MLSADISGFTALSEKLAGKGKAGAEEITSLINTCFTALIESAYKYGGEVIKFGGDALLILFRGDNHERRAADAGLLMQRALHSSPAAKRANLTMTVGAAAGPFDVFLVGSGYRELLITGPRASEVIRLEGEAGKGDTLVDTLIAEQLPDDMKLREEHSGWVITGSTGDTPTGPGERHLGHDDLTPYVPAAVVEQLAAFSGTGGEHRLVTVGFLMVIGVRALLDRKGPDAVADAFHRLVDDVERIGTTFGVTPLHTDIAPDGIKFVLCAGAPVNPGDTSDALLQAALQFAAVESPLVLRQGVQTGRVFAGFLGSEFRRTYTLMGDPVNTAARMLGKADDRDVVAVASVVRDTRTIFITEELEPFLVKGKTEPIVAHKVLAASDEVRRDTSGTKLVGRQRELDVLTHAIGELGEVVILSGSAGVGKSRLLDAAWAAAEGLQIFQGACTPYGAASPYSVFRPLLRVGSGIDVNADPVHAGELLEKIVKQAAPDLLPMLPLLAVPFGARVAPTPEADAIDPKFRRSRTHDAVVDFLDRTLDGPVLLVVEDAHWIDDASGELINHLIRASGTRPWAGILTRRPEGPWRPPDGPELLRQLDLEPLTDHDIRELSIELSARNLSDHELDTIVGRAGGNPLFAVELVRAIDQHGGEGLPETVEDLISVRIDGLPPDQRRLLRVAAVFGRDFDAALVSEVAGEAVAITTDLDDMVEHTTGTRYRFRHAMYRDAAYEGLPFGQRRRLHARTAEVLEQNAVDPLEHAALLSLHFAAARRHVEAYRYASHAADAAARAFAHQDAAELYQRALEAGRWTRHVSNGERARLSVELGRSLEFAGLLEAADSAYRRVTRYTDDTELRVDCTRRRARVRQKQNRLSAAVRLLGAAERQLAELPRTQARDRRLAEIHLGIAGVRMDQGRLRDARAESEAAQRCAIAADNQLLQVQAYAAMAGATTAWEEAQQYVDILERGDIPVDGYEARSMLATNLGMAAFFAGEWNTAVELYELGRSSAETMGNVTLSAAAAMNAAEILLDQGSFETALELLAEVRRVFAAAGYEAALLYADLLYGVALTRLGQVGDAGPIIGHCEAQFESGSMQLYALESAVRAVEVLMISGEWNAAREKATATLGRAGSVDRASVIEVRSHRLLGIIAHVTGNSGAAALLRSAEDRCRADGMQYELALTLMPLAAIDPSATAETDEASEIFERLGILLSGRPTEANSWLPGVRPG